MRRFGRGPGPRWSPVSCAACLAACTEAPAVGSHVTIHIAPVETQADQPVSMKVSGLPPGDVVSLRLRTTDAGGVAWSSFAAFRASQAGVVDPATSAAVAGNYRGVSAMGLFWSIVPQGTPPGGDYFWNRASPLSFQLSVAVNGDVKASARLSRRLANGPLSVTPRAWARQGSMASSSRPRRRGVLRCSSSAVPRAASRQRCSRPCWPRTATPALAIAYFKEPGLPWSPSRIPLEYFARALSLRARPR